MNLADTISSNLASLNIFGGLNNSEKTKLSDQKQKVSELLSECSSYILTRVNNEPPAADSEPAYLKTGPGQVDFGYIAMEELIEVRLLCGVYNSSCVPSFCFDCMFDWRTD